MYDRFTDRARAVMLNANAETQRLNHDHIGTEHILLGIIKQADNSAWEAFKRLGVDAKAIRTAVETLAPEKQGCLYLGRLPHSAHAKKVIEYAIEEALGLHHNYVDAFHILLGLLRDPTCGAAVVMAGFGITRERVLAALFPAMPPITIGEGA